MKKVEAKMKDKPTKIIFEYPDRIDWLEGKPAQKQMDAANGMCMMGHVHGNDFPEFRWHTKKK